MEKLINAPDESHRHESGFRTLASIKAGGTRAHTFSVHSVCNPSVDFNAMGKHESLNEFGHDNGPGSLRHK